MTLGARLGCETQPINNFIIHLFNYQILGYIYICLPFIWMVSSSEACAYFKRERGRTENGNKTKR
ncbi:hypothetical protein IRB23SM22_07180 [Alkalibacterium sp. s-m-22]